MGKGGSAPEPSKEERALQSEQLRILKEQQATSTALEPYYLRSLGLKKAGNDYVPMTEEEKYALMTDEDKFSSDISKLQQERTQKALKGELPVSKSLESELSGQQEDLEEYLARKLGKNWRLSTPGLTKLGEFNQQAEQLRESQRYGDIDTGTGLMLANQNSANEAARRTQEGYKYLGTNQLGLTSSYNQAMQPYQNASNMNMQAQIIRNQNTSGTYRAIGSAIGTVGGAYASKYSGGTREGYANNPYRRQG